MAPSNPSPYFFSASKLVDSGKPTLVECVAASPPRRVPGAQLTVTRIFKNRGISLKKLKDQSKKPDVAKVVGRPENPGGPSSQRAGSAPPSASQRGGTPGPSSQRRQTTPAFAGGSSPLSSPASSPPPSTPPPSSPLPVAVARARSPNNMPTSVSAPPVRTQCAPYHKRPGGSRLTRSASRSSLKGSKIGRGSSIAAIEKGTEPIFIREERNTSTTEPDVMTFFWESFTTLPLRQPPNLTSRPDLAYGDVYINIVRGEVIGQANTEQLWIWTEGADGLGFWKSASQGDVRDDGRRLTITPKRLNPSWVAPTWAVKQLRKTR